MELISALQALQAQMVPAPATGWRHWPLSERRGMQSIAQPTAHGCPASYTHTHTHMQVVTARHVAGGGARDATVGRERELPTRQGNGLASMHRPWTVCIYLQSIAGDVARGSERGRLSKSNEEDRHTKNRVPSTKLGWAGVCPKNMAHWRRATNFAWFVQAGTGMLLGRGSPGPELGRAGTPQRSCAPPQPSKVRQLPMAMGACTWEQRARVGMFASSQTVIGWSNTSTTPPALKASCYAALKLKHITQHLACSRWSGMPKPSQSASARRPLPSPSSRHSALTLACTAFMASPDSAPAQG